MVRGISSAGSYRRNAACYPASDPVLAQFLDLGRVWLALEGTTGFT